MTMNALQAKLTDLPTIALGGRPHLSYQAVTDTVAAFLYPAAPMDATAYQRVLETADSVCRKMGYTEVVR